MGHPLTPGPGDKPALRAAARVVWSSADRAEASRAVTRRVLTLPEVRRARTVAAYVGGPGEIDTEALLAALRGAGLVVLLPVLEEDSSLTWRRFDPAEPFVAGRRGTVQPDGTSPAGEIGTADVVVVPGLAFDVRGGRLGRGGGSYDRALRDARADALVVALAPDEAVVPRVPMEPHDRAVDAIVTPTQVIRCGG